MACKKVKDGWVCDGDHEKDMERDMRRENLMSVLGCSSEDLDRYSQAVNKQLERLNEEPKEPPIRLEFDESFKLALIEFIQKYSDISLERISQVRIYHEKELMVISLKKSDKNEG